MDSSLITTKVVVPQLRDGIVARKELVERLKAGLTRPLTLVSAPAGYGKTTLLAELATQIPVAWLSLDEEDNDPIRFWTHFITALQTVEPRLAGLQNSLISFDLPTIRPVLVDLINEVSSDEPVSQPHVMILDDYQLIEEKNIHNDLVFLLGHLPDQIRLIISTRSDPPLPLAKMRSRGQLKEFRAQELRFSLKEIETIFNGVMGLGLSSEQIAALEARTEGWIASLQMAALSLQKQSDIPAFIKEFTGTHRYLLDYLTEEVLNQQTESTRSFLMETSVLHQLSGPLCDAVTGRQDGQEMLRKLEAANMFMVPLDDERQWYRYHHLFASLLSGILRERYPEMINELNKKAADWLSRSGFQEEAVSYALTAEDYELAAQLMMATFHEYTFRFELYTMLKRLARIPDKIVMEFPRLGLYYAFVFSFTGKIDEAEMWLKRIEGKVLSRGDESDVAVTRANIAVVRRDDLTAIEILKSRFEDVDDARDFDTKPDMMSNLNSKLYAGLILSYIYKAQGDLHLAIETGLQLLNIFNSIPPQAPQRVFLIWPHMVLAEFFYEQNNLDSALHHAMTAVEIANQYQHRPLLANSLAILELIRQARGKALAESDYQVLETAAKEEEREDAGKILGYLSTSLALMARTRFAGGNFRAILRCVKNFKRIANPDQFPHVISVYPNDSVDVAHAYAYLAERKLGEAETLLKNLQDRNKSTGRYGNLIEILLLLALTVQARGDSVRAVDLVSKAITIAEPKGYIRIFVDMGPSMRALLIEAAKHNGSPAYIQKLLIEFEKERADHAELSYPLAEPLTSREIEILHLLADGLSNREIARKLILGLGTVKTHTHHIYAKLGVRTRAQAIKSATNLNLL
jgi:ATP/maltotriose-dependent transcriptional regulator MalT